MIKTDGINIIEPKIIYIGFELNSCIFKPVFDNCTLVLWLFRKTSQTHTQRHSKQPKAFENACLKVSSKFLD